VIATVGPSYPDDSARIWVSKAVTTEQFSWLTIRWKLFADGWELRHIAAGVVYFRKPLAGSSDVDD
jgi:hypothetical protein